MSDSNEVDSRSSTPDLAPIPEDWTPIDQPSEISVNTPGPTPWTSLLVRFSNPEHPEFERPSLNILADDIFCTTLINNENLFVM